MREYPMSLSTGVKIVSALATLLVLAVPLLVWSVVPGVRLGPGTAFARWAVFLVPVIPLASWALAPSSIELQGGELRILRRAWRAAAYPLQGVEEVAVLPPRWLLGSVRTFGNGGLFGYYGWFYKKGAYRLFATRRDRLVEVVVGGKRVVVSPDEPGRLVEGLLASAPRARLRQPVDAGAARASKAS